MLQNTAYNTEVQDRSCTDIIIFIFILSHTTCISIHYTTDTLKSSLLLQKQMVAFVHSDGFLCNTSWCVQGTMLSRLQPADNILNCIPVLQWGPM